MSRRRPSLMEILAEEREGVAQEAPAQEALTQEPAQKSTQPTQTSSVSKADYIRLSVTLPPDVFERLQALSLSRRKAREPYTFCHLARQAIMEWLDRQEQT